MSGTNPVFGQVALDTNKLGAYSTMSNELLDDSNIDIVSMLMTQWAENIGQEIDNQVFNGDGTYFHGIIANAGGSVTATTSGTAGATYTKFSEMVAQVPNNRLLNAKYYVHRVIADKVRTQTDGTNYIWNPAGNLPQQIAGYPVALCEKMPYSGASSTALAVLCDLRNYTILRRLGMKVDVDPFGLFTTDQTRMRVVSRWDGHYGLANNYVKLIGA